MNTGKGREKGKAENRNERERPEKLMDAIGRIDDEQILETERFRSEGERKARLRRRRRLGTFAGTVAAAALLGLIIAIPQSLRMGRSEFSGGAASVQCSESDDSAIDTAEWALGSAESAAQDSIPELGSDGDSGEAQASAEREAASAGTMGENAEEMLAEGRASAGENSVEGADAQSEKAEDTPAEEPTGTAGEDYPESLLALQERISRAMVDGELPFVSSSAIREEPLRLEVCVTTEDEELLEILRSLDPGGEWLAIVSGSGAALE